MVANNIEEFNLETLMRMYGNDVLRTAYMYVKDLHTAEDIFQEVFLKVNMHFVDFRNESAIKTWILKITINTCKDFLKSAWSQHVDPVEDFQTNQIVEDGYSRVEKQEQKQTIKEAIMSLPDKYKDVILCVYYQEMSIEETSKILHCAEGTIKSRLNRARQKIKTYLEGGMSYE